MSGFIAFLRNADVRDRGLSGAAAQSLATFAKAMFAICLGKIVFMMAKEKSW